MEIFQNQSFVKNVKKVHFFRSDNIAYSLSEVLKNNYEGFISSDDYLQITPLYANVKPDSGQKKSNSGVYWSHRIGMTISGQSAELRQKLDSYDNAKVVCALETTSDKVYLYGNSSQPLKMLYKDLESTNNLETIGHEIKLSGDTYGSPKIISTSDFYTANLLASWLATPL